MGWFHGFKLHLLINDMGEIVNFFVTPGNVDDRNEEVMDALSKGVFGKLIGDKGVYLRKTARKIVGERDWAYNKGQVQHEEEIHEGLRQVPSAEKGVD
jgi:hypothetical protein